MGKLTKVKEINSTIIDKTKEINDAAAALNKLEEERKLAIEEEAKSIEELKQNIDDLCKEKDVFCGIILTLDDITNIIKLAVQTQENIKIPYNIYNNNI